VPKWLIWTCVVLWLVALAFGTLINLSGVKWRNFPSSFGWPSGNRVSGVGRNHHSRGHNISIWLMALGYVYRDARRRRNEWRTLAALCMLLSWPFFAIGFILYFQVREPLPFPCPRCSTMVGARFNFCPNCKGNLHPSCPNCKREGR